MRTQKEQLTGARRAYIIELTNNPNSGVDRFAVYLEPLSGEPLAVLWPSDTHEGAKSKELLHCQVYSKQKQYPAYHFCLKGWGYSKPYDIALALQAINPALDVYRMGGHMPERVAAGKVAA